MDNQPVIQYDKLVRDDMPKIYRNDGVKSNYRVVAGVEKLKYLNAKLLEEVAEYLKHGDIDEIADILEVLKGIAAHHEVPFPKIEKKAYLKSIERGCFYNGIVLENLIVGENDG